MPYLASPLLRINLAEELSRLRSEQSWQRSSGRSSKTLAKYPDFHMVLVLMKANTRMNKHHVDARISIHALEGRLRVRLSDQVVEFVA
jgi:quercetin dioxygenase-like cupin family protein